MEGIPGYEELVATQKKEKKELMAKTQKMKHSIPKGDKKKKKEVTEEIALLLADLDVKHENELRELEDNLSSSNCAVEGSEASKSNSPEDVFSSKSIIPNEIGSTAGIGENSEESANKGADRISKAQKRRNKKALAEKERKEAIAIQEIENLKSFRHLEAEKIKKKLAERNLMIHEVPADGNCLYKAIEHQLSLNSKQISVQTLREQTAQYLLQNRETYLPFLISPEGHCYTIEEFGKYCDDIANTSAWGGHIEIEILSIVCGMPIEVIQAESDSIIAGAEKCDPKLIISYHRHVYGLGEHYNSVVPIPVE